MIIDEEEADMIINAFKTEHESFGLKKPQWLLVQKLFKQFPVLQKHHYTFVEEMDNAFKSIN